MVTSNIAVQHIDSIDKVIMERSDTQGTTTKDELVQTVLNYESDTHENVLREACDFAEYAHRHQTRASGSPYFQHPLEVAKILADMKLDAVTIITALLHDTVEDTEATLDEIEDKFGPDVAKLVDGVTKLTQIKFQSENIKQAENFRKLLLAMSADIRVILIKLADRLHNMRTIHFVKKEEKRHRISLETLEIYAPLAERMGIQQIKNELQDIAFAELYPDIRQSINKRLQFLHKQEDTVINLIIKHITGILEGHVNNPDVTGREKSPHSIWKKMESKNIGFEQLSDIIAFRVIVDSVADCYRVLGLLHGAYHNVPDNFKDYISTPKNNGYQSLHTVVMGPEDQCIEIQIRTEEMHDVAEYGIAAHWSYKQGHNYSADGKEFRWLRELLEILNQTDCPEEFLENTKLEMYYDQVFCFTPKGDLIAMPKGATAIDFAYAVHSKVGHHCIGAKRNGRIIPLRTELHNGDQIEVICAEQQTPSAAWERFVVTGKARSEIRKFIKQQQRIEYVNLGRSILSKALQEEGYELKDDLIEPILENFSKKNVEDLLASVGEGTHTKVDILRALFPKKKFIQSRKSLFSFFRKGEQTHKAASSVPINGLLPGMAVHYAGCCHPLPGEKIVGIVNTGKGITIHTTDCIVLENYSDTPERWIDVSWDKTQQGVHLGRLKVIISHESGSLATLANNISKNLGNIANLKIINRSSDFFEILVDVEVRGEKHFSNIISALRAETVIHSVDRYKD